ncbi:MAG: hypothetical protein LRY67_07360 [Gammaproteobacteria bacterium]|nr:hypothetical protein [Gammaproteobacteria bacterium]
MSFGLFSLMMGITPLFFYGINIYKNFYLALGHIQWYSLNWNASLYGFFSRLLGETSQRTASILHIPTVGRLLYHSVSILYVCIMLYFFKKKNPLSLAFSFTLSSMLLLSPLGWNYYFPLLITAMMITVQEAERHPYYPIIMCLLFLSIMISGYPLTLNRDAHISTHDLLFQSNLFFLALILFTMANSIPLFFSPQKKSLA